MWKYILSNQLLARTNFGGTSSRRRGTAVVLVVVTLPVLFGVAALTIDVGRLQLARQEVQTAADAASLAGVASLPEEMTAIADAHHYVNLNIWGNETAYASADVRVGHWNTNTGTFVPSGAPVNAVEVIVGRPVELIFAAIFGIDRSNVLARAVAVRAGLGVATTRFLIDNEMIDSDIPVIEDLAASLGISPIDLISDLDGDWFIDLPPGVVLELPTGQLGDPGLFDVANVAFPFTNPATGGKPPLEDFLNYNEDGSWRDMPAVKHLLDPLVGVATVEDPNEYASFVNPDAILVSPIYINDVSTLGPVPHPQSGTPAINALGQRRGLLAFKVLGIGADPDGPGGSLLPNLIIEIVNPAMVNLALVVQGSTGATTQPMLAY